MKYTPHPYQERGRKFIVDNPRCQVFQDMGLGKTVQMLTAIADMHSWLEVRRVLVIAPIRVCESTWPAEIAKWDHTRHLSHVVVRGTPDQRSEALLEDADIYLINFELIPWLCDMMEDLPGLRWDMLVVDESSKMKAHDSQRFRALKKYLSRFRRRVVMTGTPRPNTFLDLWSQVYLVDRGQRLGDFFTHYKDRYFDSNPWSYEVKLKEGAAERIQDQIRDSTLCLMSEDYLKLPDLIENVVRVELPENVREAHDRFQKDMIAQLNGVKLEAFNAGALTMRLRQITSGAMYDKQEEAHEPRTWTKLHDAKLDALEEIIDGSGGENIIVVYEFHHELERLLKRWPGTPWIGGGSKKSDEIIKQWQAGWLPLLFVHPASVGHGLNLQDGGHIMAWTSGTWSLELWQQMCKRLHRQGQTHPVMVHLLVATGTIDEVVAAVLREKHAGQAAMLAALKSYVAAL